MSDANVIIEAVRTRFAGHERYEAPAPWIVHSNSFLWGSMHSVRFKRNDGSLKTVYAWEGERDQKTGKAEIQIFENAEDIVSFVSSRRDFLDRIDKVARESFLAKITLVDVVSGTIAILLTLSIVFVTVYQGRLDVPGILANALTIILGFYFGRATTSSPQPI